MLHRNIGEGIVLVLSIQFVLSSAMISYFPLCTMPVVIYAAAMHHGPLLSIMLHGKLNYMNNLLRSVCLMSTCISQKPLAQISPNFLHMLHVAAAQSSSDGNAICYVLDTMTPCIDIMQGIGQNQTI